jgi:hypothetical protein
LRRVVVTGMGMVTPLGCGVEHTWARLIAGESGAKAIDTFDVSDIACKIAGVIPIGDGTNGTYNPDQWMEPKEQRKVDKFIVYAMCAAKQALEHAGWKPTTPDEQNTTGVMIGAGIGGVEGIADTAVTLHERGPRRVSPFFIPGRLINLASGQVSLAMSELGSVCSYLLCDLDGESAADLQAAAFRLGLASGVRVVTSDGMTALHEALDSPTLAGTIVAHIDPYDPWAVGPCGLSSVDLACELIERKIGLVYWYGYDRPEQRAWAFDELCQRSETRTAWCGDVMVRSDVVDESDGDLGDATTPGTGFGVVLDNVSPHAISACQTLGEEFARAYNGVPLPGGSPGYLAFTIRTAANRE